jgi:RNA polymerase sigma-70 factor, ECF subfamily
MDKFEAWVAQTTTQYRRVKKEEVEALLAEARSGGQAAVGELRRRYGPSLEVRLSRYGSLAAEHAAEVVDDVFLRLPATLATYHDAGRLEQWLYTQVFNRWRTVRRTLSRDRHTSVDMQQLPLEHPATAPINIDLELLRARAEAMLTETEREAWLLNLEGFSRPEIGAMLGITANAAGVRLDRAKKRLKEMMEAYL